MTLDSSSYLEIINTGIPRGQIRHALFDFDGTLSLIREGWQDVMISMMVELLMQTPHHESERELRSIVTEYVDLLTGKQTIYQMIRLAEEVEKRGGEAQDPLAYKWLYLERLWAKIAGRVEGLKAGRLDREALMVPGTVDILEAMHDRNVTCYLASGTDEVYVLDEAAALGLSGYFASIYGALDDYQSYSKKMIIDRILDENNLNGSQFATFGDGYIEIEDTKAVGGIAVGLATNESKRQGVDEWKRQRLIAAGADLVVPDFSQHQRLVAYLFEES
jgi:phosphoglycolate phosphatase-like HAD superfamily hydrolase